MLCSQGSQSSDDSTFILLYITKVYNLHVAFVKQLNC